MPVITAQMRQILSPMKKSVQVLRRMADGDPTSTSDFLSAQFQNPGDILSVLLLLGHEVVHKAIAQLAGAGPLTPVAFSYGWVAYAATALLAAFSDGKLMPSTDTQEPLIISPTTGHHRTTRNWVISRLLRDLEYSFDASTKNEASHPDPNSTEEVNLAPGQTRWEPLRVSVFEVDKTREPGVPIRDWIWFCGVGVILVQLVVSTVPWIRDGEWGPFIVTGAGTVLALISGSLPQFRKEKWACPRDGGDAVILTRGNGSRHAVLILRSKVSPSKSSEPTTDVSRGLDFEILAEGSRPQFKRNRNANWETIRPSGITRGAVAVQAFFWVLLLICTSGLKENTWYLLGIGLLGSIQNVIAASAIREPGTYGVHLNFKEKITGRSVREILKATEEKYEFAGLSLVDIFFPGSMRVKDSAEIAFWREVQDKRNGENAFGHRIDSLPP
ncbi:hypothetical protein TWF225_009813 [Orbilia oligospora]|uniref:Uncharacterized protein n=2 Tax=Orbilia oligospora TaxID=2813651 RepID=A0A8H2DNM7_ORBOL|nr:hypothetical protein TWF225_009813 [Orbilia oligospora]KAF3245192.1 hypothetical protein TWF217_010528 [Orbilia oligospora]KAF3255580.1 hypothetical protein TWF128_005574 [Orbilia oligospora]KAF3297429.1 hypothetical protein TWF132_007521 [Orbilia oligospora]TGJ63790.1 hypothetical protein EYR41_011681 [Orbilia oligospora]